MEALAGEFADIASFFTVWVPEAHPGGDYPQTETMADRRKYATDFRDCDHGTVPVVMDDLNGTLQSTMGGFPNSAYVIDGRGRVAYRANWSDSREIRRILVHQREIMKRSGSGSPLGIPRWSEEVTPALSDDPDDEAVTAIRVWEQAKNYGEPERFMGPERAARFRAAYERATGRQSVRPADWAAESKTGGAEQASQVAPSHVSMARPAER